MWAGGDGRYVPEFDEVHADGFDFNVPNGYGYRDEHVPLHEYGSSRRGLQKRRVDDGLFKDANHHLSENDYADQDDFEVQAGMSKHHCTDIMCLVVFLIAVGLVGLLVNYGMTQGDVRRLTHGYNFTGQLCGVDAPGQPYLYWCQKRRGMAGGGVPPELDLKHPICVEACPTSYNTTRTCFRKMEKTVKPSQNMSDGSYYVEETSKYIFAEVYDYNSTPFLDRYCLPKDLALSAELEKALNEHGMTKSFMELSELSGAGIPLFVAAIIAFILGYVYIFLLDKCATCLVYTAIFMVIAVGVVTGLYLIVSQFFGGIDGIPNSGDSGWNWLVGLGLLLISAFFACFAFVSHDQIEVAIACVQAAADCMFDMPTLLFEPLISLFLKIFIFIMLISGFLQLASVGEVRQMTIEQFSHYYESEPNNTVSGVFRTFHYHESQQMYMYFFVIVGVWILCVMTALSQFVIAYSVQLWYFTPFHHDHKDAPACTLWRGYWIGVGYHLGSLAYGGLVVTAFWLARTAFGALARAAETEGNTCLAAIAKCLFCCIACYERCIEFLNKNAYMDIAINSTSFCTAARNALEVIHSELTAVSMLNGATWVFTIAGHALITSTGTFLVWCMVRSLWWFNNVDSPHFIEDPVMVCALAACVCLSVSVGFMIVFDMVADCILYCYASEKRRKDRGLLPHELQYAPSSLNKLVEHHSNEHHSWAVNPHSKSKPASHQDWDKIDDRLAKKHDLEASAMASHAYRGYISPEHAPHG